MEDSAPDASLKMINRNDFPIPPPPPLPPPPFLLMTHDQNNHSVSYMPSPLSVADTIALQFKGCLSHNDEMTDIHRICSNGNVSQLSLFFDREESNIDTISLINQRNHLGCTPLRLAAVGGHYECLEYLLKAGAEVDIVDVKCQTPLFAAVRNKNGKCCQKLLESGASPDGNSGNTSTPLHMALMTGVVNIVLILLENGAHPDKLINNSLVPCSSLHEAIILNFPHDEQYIVWKALLSYGCTAESYLYHICAIHKREDLINLLYDFGVPMREQEKNLISHLQSAAAERCKQINGIPRSLQSTCRVAVISCLPKPRRGLDMLDKFPLPPALIRFLKFS